jgi:hypothetical protein
LILGILQRELERLYRLSPFPPIERFLISAEELRLRLPKEEEPRPQLLLKESEGTLSLAVHLGPQELDPRDLQGFLGAAEEISHFLYLGWKARNERPVSLLDLEVQGEIDKFLLTALHLEGDRSLLGRWFDRARFHDDVTGEALDRYRRAHRFGERFLRSLGGGIFRRGLPPRILRTLRAFYRWSSPRRLALLASL